MKQQQPQNSMLIYNQSHFLCNIRGKSQCATNVSHESVLPVGSSSGPEWTEQEVLTLKPLQAQKGCLGISDCLQQVSRLTDRQYSNLFSFDFPGFFWLCQHLTPLKNSARITLTSFNLFTTRLVIKYFMLKTNKQKPTCYSLNILAGKNTFLFLFVLCAFFFFIILLSQFL